MASLEKRGNSYRIVFRFLDKKYSRSLCTRSERSARSDLARLEDNLRRVNLGTLVIPDSADVATFLLSDGSVTSNVQKNPKRKRHPVRTLARLCDHYLGSLPDNAIESTTQSCMKIHVRHFKRIFGRSSLLAEIDLSSLQEYVNQRSKCKGRHGRPISATTIKKELASLTTIWNWALEHSYVDNALSKKGLRFPKTQQKPAFATITEVETQK